LSLYAGAPGTVLSMKKFKQADAWPAYPEWYGYSVFFQGLGRGVGWRWVCRKLVQELTHV
jgi:hypothetical protein